MIRVPSQSVDPTRPPFYITDDARLGGAILYPVTESGASYEEVVADNTLAVFDATASTESADILLDTITVRQVTDAGGNSWVIPELDVKYNTETNEYALDAGETADVTVTSTSLGSVDYTFTMDDFAFLVVPTQAAVVSDGNVVISNVVRKSTGIATSVTGVRVRCRNTTAGTNTPFADATYDAENGTITFTAPTTAGAYSLTMVSATDATAHIGTVTFTIPAFYTTQLTRLGEGATLLPVKQDGATMAEVIADNTLAVFDVTASTDSSDVNLGTVRFNNVKDSENNPWVVPVVSAKYNASTNEYALDAGETATVTLTSATLGSVETTFTMGNFPYLVVPTQVATYDATAHEVTISNVVQKTTGTASTLTIDSIMVTPENSSAVTIEASDITYDSTAGTIVIDCSQLVAGSYTLTLIDSNNGAIRMGTVTFTITE